MENSKHSTIHRRNRRARAGCPGDRRPERSAGRNADAQPASTSAFSRATPQRWSYSSSTAKTTRAPHGYFASIPANRTYHYWHTFVPGAQAGQIYGYRVHGPNDPANGLRFDPAKVLLDPYGRSRGCSQGVQPGGGARPGRQRRHRDEERGGGSVCIRLGRRYALRPALLPHDHLRNTRARLHPPSQLRAAGELTRDLCRPDRKDSLPDGTRHYRRGVDAGISVRRRRMRRRDGPTTGAMLPFRSLRRTRVTVRARIRPGRCESFGTW